jgi:predicted lipid-binding transport protein (Tim44 family)
MKLSWHSLKISIAGAKLSHLVQKDRIWDHGSMIEQVKTIFFQIQKTKSKGDAGSIKKYLTVAGYEKLKNQMEELQAAGKMRVIKNSRIKEIAVIDVITANDKHPDLFIALVKGYEVHDIDNWNTPASSVKHDDIIHEFSERWCFLRQGDWWLLDNMKSTRSVF